MVLTQAMVAQAGNAWVCVKNVCLSWAVFLMNVQRQKEREEGLEDNYRNKWSRWLFFGQKNIYGGALFTNAAQVITFSYSLTFVGAWNTTSNTNTTVRSNLCKYSMA